jgi:hypothetical protein
LASNSTGYLLNGVTEPVFEPAFQEWRHTRVVPNLFGIPFGIAGLADVWAVAQPVLATPPAVAHALYLLSASVWLIVLAAYLRQGIRLVLADLRDRAAAPFVSLAVITPLLVSSDLGGYALGAAQVLVAVFLGLTVVLGGWLTGQWIRELFHRLAGEGRTVLVSSHLMSEMALTAEDLIVIGRGRLIAQTTVAEFTANAGAGHVIAGTRRLRELADLLHRQGVTVTETNHGTLQIDGLDATRIGEIALAAGIVLSELHTVGVSLEDAFMELTNTAVDYRPSTLEKVR